MCCAVLCTLTMFIYIYVIFMEMFDFQFNELQFIVACVWLFAHSNFFFSFFCFGVCFVWPQENEFQTKLCISRHNVNNGWPNVPSPHTYICIVYFNCVLTQNCTYICYIRIVLRIIIMLIHCTACLNASCWRRMAINVCDAKAWTKGI